MNKNNIIHYLLQTGILLLELLLFAFLVGAISYVAYTLVGPLVTELNIFTESQDDLIARHPYKLLAAIYIPITFILLLSIWLSYSFILGRNEELLGFTKTAIFKNVLIGGGYSLLILIIGFFVLLLFQQIQIIGFEWNGTLILGFFLMFCIQSFSEEIIFRAYLIPVIENRLGTWAALIISSLGFMLIHLGNNNFTWLACSNLILGGILMGLLFIKYRNIWVPTGMHIFWNYIQSTILGFEVSGEKTYSLLIQNESGMPILTGGDFGYEGSIISVILLALCIVWIVKNLKIKNSLSHKN